MSQTDSLVMLLWVFVGIGVLQVVILGLVVYAAMCKRRDDRRYRRSIDEAIREDARRCLTLR